MPRRRRRGFDSQAKKGARRFFLARLAQNQKPATGGAGLQAQAPALGEAEFLGVAMYFQQDGGKGPGGECCLDKPERILQSARQGMDQSAW